MLAALVGRAMGHRLFALSHNIDARRVQTGHRRRSVGAQRALGRPNRAGRHSPEEIDATVVTLIDRITRRMRAAGRTGRTVVLRMRFDDFGRATRSRTLPWATSSTEPILTAARGLVAAAARLIAERGLTLIGFSVANIDRSGAQQLELPFEPPFNQAPIDMLAIDAAVDRVRQRYGTSAISRGVLVGRSPGLEMPHLPD
jgi:DNA polymerase IV